jgi:hypothetical protein
MQMRTSSRLLVYVYPRNSLSAFYSHESHSVKKKRFKLGWDLSADPRVGLNDSQPNYNYLMLSHLHYTRPFIGSEGLA